MPKQKRWTKRCSGSVCKGAFGEPFFIPDDVDICDSCLLAKYGMVGGEVEVYGDPLGMINAYTEETVIKALREAEKR